MYLRESLLAHEQTLIYMQSSISSNMNLSLFNVQVSIYTFRHCATTLAPLTTQTRQLLQCSRHVLKYLTSKQSNHQSARRVELSGDYEFAASMNSLELGIVRSKRNSHPCTASLHKKDSLATSIGANLTNYNHGTKNVSVL